MKVRHRSRKVSTIEATGQDYLATLPVEDKELHWIEGTTRRFDGYNYFGLHPEVPIDWFTRHLK